MAREGFAFARFEGALSGPAKDAAIAKFRERVPVLLCTESGGEGRNLQFCNTLIIFDVPWNPMVIEQRIGRIDRIGQQREVFVFNLVTRGTLEQQILSLLDEKISMFELVVGEVGAILGGLDEDRDSRDGRQAAPASQSRAPARADARRHGAQHARGILRLTWKRATDWMAIAASGSPSLVGRVDFHLVRHIFRAERAAI